MSRSDTICSREGNYVAVYDIFPYNSGRIDDVKTWIPIGFRFPRQAGIKVTWSFVNAVKSESQVILLEENFKP